MLYGAYVAGLIVTYISKPPISTSPSPYDDAYTAEILESRQHELSFEESFTRMVGPLQNYLLLPLFFASIGFAIVSCLLPLLTSSALMVDIQPFLDLWQPTVLWKGIVYAVLMCLAKLAVGLPILFYPATVSFAQSLPTRTGRAVRSLGAKFNAHVAEISRRLRREPPPATRTEALPGAHKAPTDNVAEEKHAQSNHHSNTGMRSAWYQMTASIPPAVFMGVAMVSRGEIGLLIAQLARTGTESNGVSSESRSPGLLGDEAFLVAIWAILLCTLVGPISVGLVVRKWGSNVTAGIWA